jgi:hypothetical protein
MSREYELLPCPFCGGDPKLVEVEPSGYVVECTNGICHASTNIRFSCGEDARPLVAEQWNRRAALTASPQAAPEGGPGRLTLALHAYEKDAIRSTRGRVLNHNKCMARVVEAIAANPQVQGGEAGCSHEWGAFDEYGIRQCAKCRTYQSSGEAQIERMKATPQRAPGVDALRSAFYMVSPRNLTANEFVDKVRALEAALASGPSGETEGERRARELYEPAEYADAFKGRAAAQDQGEGNG